MIDKVSICNAALSRIAGDPITDIDENSRNALLCKLNYDILRAQLQQSGLFSFAMKRTSYPSSLSPEPDNDWGYKYVYNIPAGQKVLYISEDQCYNDTHDWDQIGTQLHCNISPVYVTATIDEENVTKFSLDFVECLILKLAATICIPVSESRTLMNDLVALFDEQLKVAIGRDNRMKQRNKHNHQSSSLITARIRGF